MATRPQSSPAQGPQRATTQGTVLPTLSPRQQPAQLQQPPQSRRAETQPLPTHPDHQLEYKPETEADRQREAHMALHGPRIAFSDNVGAVIFNVLTAAETAFRTEERYQISRALAEKIWEIVDYVDAHDEPAALRNRSIELTISEAFEWDKKGIPTIPVEQAQPGTINAKAIETSLIRAVNKILPPVKHRF